MIIALLVFIIGGSLFCLVNHYWNELNEREDKNND